MEDFRSDDDSLDVALELSVAIHDLTDQESDSEEEVNALLETLPEVSQTAKSAVECREIIERILENKSVT